MIVFVNRILTGGESLATNHRPSTFGNLPRPFVVTMFGLLCVFATGEQLAQESEEESGMSEEGRDAVVVSTRLGDVQGLRQSGTLHFRSLPYAQSPTGDLRFKAPQPLEAWTGVRDATQFPNRCIQAPSGELFGEAIGALSEDCLYLNIVTPSTDGSHRPVMFWIHGGGFTQGTANGYDGSMLASQGDVVVVAINYRLGLLGFLDLSALGEDYAGSANNGILDQVAALRWVQDNIADFGGDPDNVTIFGESAGGASVLTLLATPSADGLYHKAIAHSPGTTETPPSNHVDDLIEILDTPKELVVQMLLGLPAAEVFTLQSQIPDVSMGAAIDDIVVTRTPYDAIRDRNKLGVPLIVGTNRDEGTLFSAIIGMAPPSTASSLIDGIARAVTAGGDPQPLLDALRTEYPSADDLKILERVFDAMFLKAALGSATQATDSGKGGWLYRFDYATTESVLGSDVGATHAAEIPFTFNRFNSTNPERIFGYDPSDAVARDLAQRWSATLIMFAKTGDPNGAGLPEWPNYDTEMKYTMVLDAESSVKQDPSRNMRELLEKVVTDH